MLRNLDDQQNAQSPREASTCLKIAARGLGIVGGCVAFGTGIWVATAIIFANWISFVVGAWQALAGLICVVIEAPSCFPNFQAFVERHSPWAKALLYIGMGAPPIFFMYSSPWVWLGSGAVLATGGLYGFISLGKRASLEEMARASVPNRSSTGMQSSLVYNVQPMGTSLHV